MGKNIRVRVNNLVRRCGTANPFQIAQTLRIPVRYAPLPPNIRGFLTKPVRRKIIVLNENLDEREQYIVVAHELGHALMHCGTGYAFHADTANYCRSANEYEANLFALYLLSHSYDIDDRLLQAVPRNRELFTYQEAHQLLCRCVETN